MGSGRVREAAFGARLRPRGERGGGGGEPGFVLAVNYAIPKAGGEYDRRAVQLCSLET